MPQMAPLNWTCLYIIFILITTMFMILNFYFKTFKKLPIEIENKSMIKNWKW